MLKTALLLALLANALPAPAATVDVQADYSLWGGTYTAIDNGGIPGHIGALVQPALHQYQDAGGDYYTDIINAAVPFVATGDYYPIGQAQANGNAAGNIAVQAGFLGPRGGPVDSLHAKTTWSETVVNQSGADQAYAFDFHIDPGGILAGADAAGTWSSGGMQASYNIEILLNNNPIWSSAASLQVGKDGDSWNHILTLTGTELARTYSDSLTYANCAGYNNCAGYTFGGYDGVLNLGTLANNGSFTLSYLMEVSVAGPVTETGAYAAFGDPLNLSGGGMSAQLVPEPESYAMMLAGLGLLGWMARRRG